MEEKNSINTEFPKGRRSDSLLFKFGVVFAVFSIITSILCGIVTYWLQERIYQEEVRNNVRKLAEYLQVLIKADDEDFVQYQEYMLEHYREVKIPADFDGNYLPALSEYEHLFAQKHKGKTLGIDITFEELDPQVQHAFAVYTHEYWLNVFESAARIFDVEYTYYITPAEEPYHMYYLIDAIRDVRHDPDGDYLNLCLDIEEDLRKYPVMWEVWESGETTDQHDIFNNQYGHNYAYYSPLFIDGKKIGLIAVDVAIEKVNKEILRNALIFTISLAFIILAGTAAVLIFIYRRYITRLGKLLNNIKRYTETKDPGIANAIEYDERTKDEIAIVANQTAAMISEIDKYMKNLKAANRELLETKQQAFELQALANKDALTGIRNKIAYDDEYKRLEWEVAGGFDKFGLGKVDLNFLKEINEEFGPDKGDEAIRKLCMLVCNIFQHSPVFRTNVDEFSIILKNSDYENVDKLVQEFNDTLAGYDADESLEMWEKISASIGIALFDKNRDFKVEDVLKRSEANMNKRKQEMKAIRE